MRLKLFLPCYLPESGRVFFFAKLSLCFNSTVSAAKSLVFCVASHENDNDLLLLSFEHTLEQPPTPKNHSGLKGEHLENFSYKKHRPPLREVLTIDVIGAPTIPTV